jgi:hypothetical protein
VKEIVINRCFGGFGLSHKAVMRYAELKGIKLYPFFDDISKKVYGERATLDNPDVMVNYTLVPEEEYKRLEAEDNKKPVAPGRFDKSNAVYFSERDIERTDPILIQVIRELKSKANSRFSKLKIVKIPDDVEWEIEEYDGSEWVAEKHRTWS